MKPFIATPKQLEILSYLLRVRGATINQMLIGIERLNPKSPNWSARMRAMYLKTDLLLSKGMITKIPTAPKDQGNVFHLTKKGLEEIYLDLNIEEGHVGKGFNNDLGYIPHSTYEPSVKKHFSLQTDIHNEMLNLIAEQPGVYDYRDNLHSVYKDVDDRHFLRPDAEMLIDDELYVIEADRGTERGDNLIKKFSNYASHFDSLKSIGHQLPKGIIFVTPNRGKHLERLRYDKEKTRFMSVYKKFETECQAHLREVRLIFVELRKLKEQIVMLHKENRLRLMTIHLPEAIRKTIPSSTFLKFSGWGEKYISIHINDGGPSEKHVILLETEGFESSTWTNGIKDCEEIAKKIRNRDIDKKYTFYFVCCYSKLHTEPPYRNAKDDKDKDKDKDKDDDKNTKNPFFRDNTYFIHENLYFLNVGPVESLRTKEDILQLRKLRQESHLTEEKLEELRSLEKKEKLYPSLIWYNSDHKIMDKAPYLY